MSGLDDFYFVAVVVDFYDEPSRPTQKFQESRHVICKLRHGLSGLLPSIIGLWRSICQPLFHLRRPRLLRFLPEAD